MEFKTSKKCYLQSIIAVRRRIKILELLQDKILTTKQITTELDEKAARIIEDMQRLKHEGYVIADHKGNCPLGKKQSFFYKKTKKKYYGYEFIASIEMNDDLETALKEYNLKLRLTLTMISQAKMCTLK
jgi:predicted transcriptional regulator